MSGAADGGRAFPGSYGDEQNPGWIGGGMTMLDYYAGQALAGEMANRTDFAPGWQDQMAWRCYSVARAMLAARAKGGDA